MVYNPGKIKNCFVTGKVKGHSSVGLLAGDNKTGVIFDSSGVGDVVGTGHRIGGLVGLNFVDSVIKDSSFVGSVSGNDYVGGFVGINDNSKVVRSYSEAKTQGTMDVGGFVGRNNVGEIKDSYSLGNVIRKSGSSATTIGGFIGFFNNEPGPIKNSYSIGKVTYEGSTDPTDKGFSGNNLSSSSENNYWNKDTSLQTTSPDGAQGTNTADMKTKSTFTPEWDFSTIWSIQEEVTYPYLRGRTQDPLPQ